MSNIPIDRNNIEKLLEIEISKNNYNLKLNDYKFDEEGNISSPNSTWFLLRKSFMEEKMNEYNIKEDDIIKIGRITLKVKKIKFNNKKDNLINNTNLKEIQEIQTEKKIVEKEEKENKHNICRICYLEEESPDNPLIQPCTCSGSMKYIHLECLKHWLNTSIFVKVDSNNYCSIYLKKPVECELCKTKYPDFIRHKGKLYELLDFQNDYQNYLLIESITMDKNKNKYLYVVSLEQSNNVITIGRGHDCQLILGDISISRWHCSLIIDKHSKKITIQDNDSKFGTLILVQSKNIILCQDLKLNIQIGRTFLEVILMEVFNIFNCCGVSEKKNEDFYYLQNNKKNFYHSKLTVKTEYDIYYDKFYKNKNEDEKTRGVFDNMINSPNFRENMEQKKLEREESEIKEEVNIDDIENLILDKKSNDIIERNDIHVQLNIEQNESGNINENELIENNNNINLSQINNM